MGFSFPPFSEATTIHEKQKSLWLQFFCELPKLINGGKSYGACLSSCVENQDKKLMGTVRWIQNLNEKSVKLSMWLAKLGEFKSVLFHQITRLILLYVKLRVSNIIHFLTIIWYQKIYELRKLLISKRSSGLPHVD